MPLFVRRFAVTLLGMLVLAPLTAWAQDGADTRNAVASRVAQANANTVGVISGGISGTYVQIAADLANVLDDGDRLRVLPILGKGSLQNIADILYLRGVDIGIVQSDALAYAARQHLFPGVGHSIQYITKLYEEEVHVLARKDIHQLSDLAGKKVNVDVAGSGTAMTASLILDSLNIKPELVNDDQSLALEKLKRGDIAALFYVVGKPARLFSGLGADSDLHFVPIPLSPALIETYLPSRFEHAQYPNLIPEGAPVDTVAVGAVMAVYAWPPGSERYRRVENFVRAFFNNFQKFLAPARHPKWKEVNLAAKVPGWRRFPAAQQWLDNHDTVAGAGRQAAQAGTPATTH